MLVVTIGIILCAAGVGYCYLLYPSIIRRLAVHRGEPAILDDCYAPSVSVILAVHNEELVIEQCLDSLFALDYPIGGIEILVGSDGSSDRTDDILRHYASVHREVRPYFFPEQRGKMPVLNDLVGHAAHDLLFFVDADVKLQPDALRLQARHYADPTVGAVAGLYEIHSPEASSLYESERGYASLEQRIRSDESTYHSTVGLFGGNYTIRRSQWAPLPDGLVHDDFFVVLSVLHQGHRVLFEPAAVSSDLYVRTMREEFRRKSRSASRGYHTLTFFPELLLPRAGRTAFLLWSHKLLRWLSPLLAIGASIFAWWGYSSRGMQWCGWLLVVAAGVIALSVIGVAADAIRLRVPVVEKLTWFIVMNVAYIAGTMRFLTHTDEAIWKPASRPAHLRAEVSGS